MANQEHLDTINQGVGAWNTWRWRNPGVIPNLSKANLSQRNLVQANLAQANLRNADLGGADLSRADFYQADLTSANLSGANISGGDLCWVNLSQADLKGASLKGARLKYAILADIDLSQTEGLDAVEHLAASSVGIDTLYRSGGNIPEAFLRGCGVSDQFVEYTKALVGRHIEYYSCFISYSSKDEECAQRLHADLQAANVRCWFAPHDMKIGDRIRSTIDDAIRLHDKWLLILSETSVASQWVEQEVERAMQKERDNPGSIVLFPIRLDDAVMRTPSGWPNYLRNTRNIGDFTQWKDHDAYQKAFQQLLRDLMS